MIIEYRVCNYFVGFSVIVNTFAEAKEIMESLVLDGSDYAEIDKLVTIEGEGTHGVSMATFWHGKFHFFK